MIEFVAYFRPLCVCGFFINVHKVVCSSSDFSSAPCLLKKNIQALPFTLVLICGASHLDGSGKS